MRESFERISGFEWDEGNREKNKLKHDVSTGESEQIFFNEPLIILNDVKHSQTEQRYSAFGRTNTGRMLTIVYTVRGSNIRVISARDMNKKERLFYEEED